MELIIYITITLLIASGYATFNMFRKMERLEKIVDQQNQHYMLYAVHNECKHFKMRLIMFHVMNLFKPFFSTLLYSSISFHFLLYPMFGKKTTIVNSFLYRLNNKHEMSRTLPKRGILYLNSSVKLYIRTYVLYNIFTNLLNDVFSI